MKTIASILFPVLILLACSGNNTSVLPLSEEDEIALFIQKQSEISDPIVQHLPFKKLVATLIINGITDSTKYSKYTRLFDYYPNGKLKAIISPGINGNDIDYYTYENSTLKYSGLYYGFIPLFNLDQDGLVANRQAENTKDRYYYKNGFLLRAVGRLNIKRVYSISGNLLSSEDNGSMKTYEYTDYINNIRQEVLRTTTFHWSFRDLFLGKFSTNLLKSV